MFPCRNTYQSVAKTTNRDVTPHHCGAARDDTSKNLPEPVHREVLVQVFPTCHFNTVNAVVGISFPCNLTFFVIVRGFHQMNKTDPVENKKCSSYFLPISGLLIYSCHGYFRHYETTICYINWNLVCLASYQLQRVFWPTPCSSWEKRE